VAVGVQCYGNRGVPEKFLNQLDVYALTKHQGGARMAQVVQADIRQACTGQDRLKATSNQVSGVHRRALSRRKDEPLILVIVSLKTSISSNWRLRRLLRASEAV
jgi:hypothetical protein